MGNIVKRTTLIVRDIAKSVEWYEKVIGMIGLLQWIDPPMPAPERPTGVTYGNPTFVVSSDDSRAAYDAAVALGAHIHAEPHEWSIKGANGMMKNFLGVSLFDPDGHFYELNQLLSESPAD